MPIEPAKPEIAGRNGIGQSGFAALRDEDAVRRLGEHARVAAKGEARLGERLVPAADHVVWRRSGRAVKDGLRRGGRRG